MVGAASFRTAEQLAVESARGGKVVDRKGEMERRQVMRQHCVARIVSFR